ITVQEMGFTTGGTLT
nr:immunoglobulin heavy chain junction region [Mus musculus]